MVFGAKEPIGLNLTATLLSVTFGMTFSVAVREAILCQIYLEVKDVFLLLALDTLSLRSCLFFFFLSLSLKTNTRAEGMADILEAIEDN